jgi:hypothetical protein
MRLNVSDVFRYFDYRKFALCRSSTLISKGAVKVTADLILPLTPMSGVNESSFCIPNPETQNNETGIFVLSKRLAQCSLRVAQIAKMICHVA